MDGKSMRDGAGPITATRMSAISWRRRHADAEVPPEAELDRVRPGDLIALGWELPDGRTERRWTEVLENSGTRWIGGISGEVADEAGCTEHWLEEFSREDVCDIWFTETLDSSAHVRPGIEGADRLVQVAFSLESSCVRRELLWAMPLADGTHRIESTPFFVGDLARGDVISTEMDATGTLWAAGLCGRAGIATVRAVIDPDVVHCPAHAIVALVRRLEGSGVQVEVSEETGIVSLAVGPDADIPRLLGVLRDLEASGEGLWEECCAPEWWLDAQGA